MSKKIYLFSLGGVAFIDSIANVYNSPENQALANDDPEKLHAFPDPTNNQTIYVKKIKRGRVQNL